MEYLDFDVEIGLRRGQEYPVVVRSQQGEASAQLRFPLDELQLESRLKDLRIALLSRGLGPARRKVVTPEEQSVRDFGQLLFETLLPAEVRAAYTASRRAAVDHGKGLRLRLRIQPPELAALPWEFLYDPRRGDYVCLSRATPLVRYPDVPQPMRQLTIAPPLRVLGLVTSPTDLPPLDSAREQARVERALGDLQGRVEFTWLPGQTWRALWAAMQRGPWHAFHFIGHGGFDRAWDEGFIALADDDGRSHLLRATQLGRLLRDHEPLRLVLLNSCEGATSSGLDVFSSTAATLVQQGIPAVLAMQYEISDRAAIEFAHAFYESVSYGLPVDAATAAARTAVSIAIDGTVEWGTPVLYMSAPDGAIFNLREAPTAGQPAASGAVSTAAAPAPAAEAAAQTERPAGLLELYQDGLGFFFSQQWEHAAALLAEVVARQPDFRDAAVKLAEARRQLELARLYDAGREAGRTERWAEAVEQLEAVTALQEDYRDAPELLEQARSRQRLQDLYAAARALHDRRDWPAVIQLFEQIHGLDPAYDPAGLLVSARQQAAAEARERELAERYSQALGHLETGQWGLAAEQLEAIQQLRPGYRQTEDLLKRVRTEQESAELYRRASAAYQAAAWPQAIDHLERLLHLQPGYRDASALLERARAQAAAGQAEAASVRPLAQTGADRAAAEPATSGAVWDSLVRLASRRPLATLAGGWALAQGLAAWLWVLAGLPLPTLEYLGWRQGFALLDWAGWAAAGAAAGAIAGLAIGLVLLNAARAGGPPTRLHAFHLRERTAAERRRVWLFAAVWSLASALAWLGPFLVSMPWKPLAEWAADRGSNGLAESLYKLTERFDAHYPPSAAAFVMAGLAAGLVGGLLTGLLLRRWDPGIGSRAVVAIVVGWVLAWGLAWLVPAQLFHSEGLKRLLDDFYADPSIEPLPLFMFIAGAVAGLLGGQIMLRRLASIRAREPGDD